MNPFLPPMRLTGAEVLREGRMQYRSVALAEGRITRGPLPGIDLSGYLILPGIVDLRSTAYLRHVAAAAPLAAGLAATDREAAASGVTTAHLSLGWSWEEGPCNPDAAEALLAELDGYRAAALTNLRVQIRAETHLVAEVPRLLAAVRRHRVRYVVFSNGLADALRAARSDPEDFEARARRAGCSPQEFRALLERILSRGKEVPRALCTLAEAFDEAGVIYGSHGDADGETREYYCMIGAKIAEMPRSAGVAVAAKAMMCPVLMGAPDIVRGGGRAGLAAVADMISRRLCDALVSDHHFPALSKAVWALCDHARLGLPDAWALISEKPAEILGLADRGRIAPGLRADLTVVNAATRDIEATICGGRLTHLSGEAARRFAAATMTAGLAAE